MYSFINETTAKYHVRKTECEALKGGEQTPNTMSICSDTNTRHLNVSPFNLVDLSVMQQVNNQPLSHVSMLSGLKHCSSEEKDFWYEESQISHNQKRRFSVVLPQCRSLLDKLRKKHDGVKTTFSNKSLSLRSTEETSVEHINDLFMEFYDKQHEEPLIKFALSLPSEFSQSEAQLQPRPILEPMFHTYTPIIQNDACVIPEQIRNKKMPYLVKKIRTGYLKFFDDKKNYGFISIFDEPNADVFVFGKEFIKSNITAQTIEVAKGNPAFVLKCRVMYYIGRHGPSRKAVNIRL